MYPHFTDKETKAPRDSVTRLGMWHWVHLEQCLAHRTHHVITAISALIPGSPLLDTWEGLALTLKQVLFPASSSVRLRDPCEIELSTSRLSTIPLLAELTGLDSGGNAGLPTPQLSVLKDVKPFTPSSKIPSSFKYTF